MDSSKIDTLLLEISKEKSYKMKMIKDFDNNEDYIDYKNQIIFMIDVIKVLQKPRTDDIRILLTGFGIQVIEKGGWIKHLEKEKEKDKLNFEKEKYDFLSKKWSYKTRKLPYFISGSALLVSILSLWLNTQKNEKIDKMNREIEKIKKQISIKTRV